MVCPAIVTGDRLLERVLGNIDCQAQLIGSYGYQALGQPGSLASLVMASLLTLFVALFGIRLMFGPSVGARDLVGEVLKVGIVLALAFSWPAFRTVIYDLTLRGPADIVTTIAPATLPDTGSGFAARLQAADDAMLRLIDAGTGRYTGAFIDNDAANTTFTGASRDDEATIGWARLVYLSGVIGSLALLRIVAALLLAIAPLAAGFLLFDATRGLFAGWLKGLALALIGSAGLTLVLAVELAVLEPWLVDALKVRALGYAIPSAPVELLALTLAFTAVQFGMVWVLAKITFYRGWLSPSKGNLAPRVIEGRASLRPAAGAASEIPVRRVESITNSMESTVRRDNASRREHTETFIAAPEQGNAARSARPIESGAQRLGSAYRRTARRSSQAARNRDRAT